MQRHFHVNFFIPVDPLEIDMQYLKLERMHLYIAQQNGFFLPLHIHREDRSMEGFPLELMIKTVMIQLDGFRRIFSAIDDSRHLAGTTQAAARTLALQCALSRADFDLHLLSPKCGPPATR